MDYYGGRTEDFVVVNTNFAKRPCSKESLDDDDDDRVDEDDIAHLHEQISRHNDHNESKSRPLLTKSNFGYAHEGLKRPFNVSKSLPPSEIGSLDQKSNHKKDRKDESVEKEGSPEYLSERVHETREPLRKDMRAHRISELFKDSHNYNSRNSDEVLTLSEQTKDHQECDDSDNDYGDDYNESNKGHEKFVTNEEGESAEDDHQHNDASMGTNITSLKISMQASEFQVTSLEDEYSQLSKEQFRRKDNLLSNDTFFLSNGSPNHRELENERDSKEEMSTHNFNEKTKKPLTSRETKKRHDDPTVDNNNNKTNETFIETSKAVDRMSASNNVIVSWDNMTLPLSKAGKIDSRTVDLASIKTSLSTSSEAQHRNGSDPRDPSSDETSTRAPKTEPKKDLVQLDNKQDNEKIRHNKNVGKMTTHAQNISSFYVEVFSEEAVQDDEVEDVSHGSNDEDSSQKHESSNIDEGKNIKVNNHNDNGTWPSSEPGISMLSRSEYGFEDNSNELELPTRDNSPEALMVGFRINSVESSQSRESSESIEDDTYRDDQEFFNKHKGVWKHVKSTWIHIASYKSMQILSSINEYVEEQLPKVLNKLKVDPWVIYIRKCEISSTLLGIPARMCRCRNREFRASVSLVGLTQVLEKRERKTTQITCSIKGCKLDAIIGPGSLWFEVGTIHNQYEVVLIRPVQVNIAIKISKKESSRRHPVLQYYVKRRDIANIVSQVCRAVDDKLIRGLSRVFENSVMGSHKFCYNLFGGSSVPRFQKNPNLYKLWPKRDDSKNVPKKWFDFASEENNYDYQDEIDGMT